MSSFWNNTATQAGSSPFAATGLAPQPGGGAAARFQSILQSAGKTPAAGAATGATGASPASTARPAASSGSSGSSSSSSNTDTTISANDFLTLLVTEMQNQDPTADTDPNEYINQLVQINSLEQLISINQNLQTVLGAASSTTPADSVPAPGSPSAIQAAAKHGDVLVSPSTKTQSSMVTPANSGATKVRAATHGNLSTPADQPAAHIVAHALDGHARAAPHGHAIRDIPIRRLP